MALPGFRLKTEQISVGAVTPVKLLDAAEHRAGAVIRISGGSGTLWIGDQSDVSASTGYFVVDTEQFADGSTTGDVYGLSGSGTITVCVARSARS